MTASPAVRPEDVLPAGADTAVVGGTEVRKGSVAAFVANCRRLESLAGDTPGRAAVLAEIERLAPTLTAVGVFDVFELRSAELRGILGARCEPMYSGG